MPELSFEELRDIVRRMVLAAILGDEEEVLAAAEPVQDIGDIYRLVGALAQITADAVPPAAPCTCGNDCPPLVMVGVLPVVDGEVDTSSLDGGGMLSIPPELEAERPGLVAFLRIVTGILAEDEEQVTAVFCAAAGRGLLPEVLDQALQQAATVVRAQALGLP
jgi:hypothetical protein